MIAYAKKVWWLSGAVDPKAKLPLSRHAHFAQLAKQGIKDPQAEVPPFPIRMLYIWEWFNELRNTTGDDLGPANMLAFFTLKRIVPTDREVNTLNRLYIELQTHTAQSYKERQ